MLRLIRVFVTRCTLLAVSGALYLPTVLHAAEPVEVTADGSQPAPSRDGAWIAFRSGDFIAKIRPNGSDRSDLVEGIDPNWNRAGNLIVFTDYQDNLFTVNATTAETTHVWSAPSGQRCEHPAWSPTADEIAISTPALAIVQYPHGPAETVACGCNDIQESAWSPDGQWIAFDTEDIYKVARTGGVPQPVVAGPLSQRFPSWSPDGRFIAYAQEDSSYDTEQFWHVWVVDSRGESFGKFQITQGLFADKYPAWSADGATLYFDSNREGPNTQGIWKVAFDSTVPAQRTSWGTLKTRYR